MLWSTSTAPAIPHRPPLSRSISTIPATSCTAISSSRCSTPTMMNGASCRSTSTTPPPHARWQCCCGRVRHLPGEIRGHLRRLVRRIRRHWPTTRLTIRGDSHYGRPEVMAWCEANGLDYIFGLPGNPVLDRLVEPIADDVRVRRAETQAPMVRSFTETRYGAKSWNCHRRVAARIQATPKGLDIRYVVTNLHGGTAEWLYATLYCARGQAENLIKLHKDQLASDRTSCRAPLANQVRLILHTAAYWLLLTVRDAIPRPQPLACAEFTTLRMRLVKIGARISETFSRVRIAFAAACPEAELFRGLVRSFFPPAPDPRGHCPPNPRPSTPTRYQKPDFHTDDKGASQTRDRHSRARQNRSRCDQA